MLKTYWNSEGLYQTTADALHDLIPDSGPVANPRRNRHLERLRKAINTYYDLYNNGLMNRKAGFSKLFGVRANDYAQPWRGFGYFSEQLYDLVELTMNGLIELAAVEQNIPLVRNPNHQV